MKDHLSASGCSIERIEQQVRNHLYDFTSEGHNRSIRVKAIVEVVPWEGCLGLLNHVYSTGEVTVQTEPERTEAHSARLSYTLWPVRGAEDRPAGVMMQVTETTQFHRRAAATCPTSNAPCPTRRIPNLDKDRRRTLDSPMVP